MSRMHFVFAILLATLFMGACQPIQAPTTIAAPADSASYTPRFEPVACRYEIPEGYQVECGNLVVPEDRNNPNGPTIRVHVLNFKAKAANPAPDPVILLPGGPAAPTMAYLWWMMYETTLDEALRGKRDTLLIEHRGSNMSSPAFYCPEMEADVAELAGLSMAEESEWSAAAYRACHDRLVAEGHDLSQYGPIDVAADVADLRLALGYEEVNVYSQSYSTLPAFYLLRDHPEGIRSATFDGVWPPEIFQTGEMLKVTQEWLDALFQACTEDPVCHRAYPDVESIFYETLTQLRDEPVALTVEDESGNQHEVMIDDLKYANYVLTLGLFGADYVGIPSGIMAVHNQGYESVAQGWLGYLAGRHGETGPGSWANAFGANLSDTCLQEKVNGNVEQAVATYAQVDSVPLLQDWANLAFIQEWVAPCEYWNITPTSDSKIGEPVTSEVPALMLVSTYDAFMAPYFTDAAIERFSNGHRFELPVSHVAALVPCGAELLTQFLSDPSQAPEARCIEEMKSDWVLPE